MTLPLRESRRTEGESVRGLLLESLRSSILPQGEDNSTEFYSI